jgi:hypothetical protein
MAKKSFNQIEPGQKIVVDPKANGLFFACCDCNLVHQMQFEVNKEGNLVVQFWRHNKKTAGLRRYRGIPLETRLTKRAADGTTGFCECGYMAKYPICTKCGRTYPPRR